MIMRLGHLPVGMEAFGAQPGEPVDVCLAKARQCDALVVMIAHRYGQRPAPEEGGDGKKSITWLEVEAALDADKPVFAFVVDLDYPWTKLREQDRLLHAKDKAEERQIVENVKLLQAFRTNCLEHKLVRDTFTTPDDLAAKLVASLSSWIRTGQANARPATQRIHQFRVVHPLQPAPHFCGRQYLLDDLHRWWQDPVHPDRVRALVAVGGEGKTAVVERFLQQIQAQKPMGSVLVWSFYEDPNTDAFLREACIVFAGEEGEGTGGRLERLQRALTSGESHLLILDGLERVQATGTGGRAKARGELEDHRLKNLLRSLASGIGNARALVTSRYKLKDLDQWEGAGYLTHLLDELDAQTAVDVLHAWNVKGTDEVLLALSDQVGNHALSVSILGSYLHHYCDGNPHRAKELDLENESEDDPLAAKLSRILAQYAKHMPDDQRDLLIRLSVFPNGVSVEAMGYLIDAGGEIAGALLGTTDRKLARLADRLKALGLIFTYMRTSRIYYTAHPFLREYFRNLLGVTSEQIQETVRARLAPSLETKPESKPTDPKMLDRYEELIEYSLLAKHFEEAFLLYDGALRGGNIERCHIYHTLGDYGRMERITSGFFKDHGPHNLAPTLSSEQRAILINNWGLAAAALGNLDLARTCHEIAGQLARDVGDWEFYALELQNLARNLSDQGHYPSAEKLFIESLQHSTDEHKYVRRSSHGMLAEVYHRLGKVSEAQQHFDKAAQIYNQPLSSLSGVAQSECLFSLGYKKDAMTRAEASLSVCIMDKSLRDIALHRCLLGRIMVLDNNIISARSHLKAVREWTVKSGHTVCILKAHILATEIDLCTGELADALTESTAGLTLAESGGYGRFAIDLLLLRARIHRANSEYRNALRDARQALDRSSNPACSYAWGEADALHLCGICHQHLGEHQLAQQRLEAALAVRMRIQHPGVEETLQLVSDS